uniref:Uncharacterized protein n=1 Tax=Parascaris equorum TaxID=6256 RepID=A0A914RXM5_PAREQ
MQRWRAADIRTIEGPTDLPSSMTTFPNIGKYEAIGEVDDLCSLRMPMIKVVEIVAKVVNVLISYCEATALP